MMKPSASRIERMLAKVEATLVPPSRKFLSAIIDDLDDEATVKKKKAGCARPFRGKRGRRVRRPK
jgi:hypothetical protein